MTEKSASPKPAPAPKRQRLAKAGILVVSLLLSLGVGEIAARIAFPPKRSVSWYHYDARYTFRHRENADVVTRDWGDGKPWRFHTNARGFRGSDWPDAPAAGTPRVLVTGDSFTFGDGLEEDEAYARVAQQAAGAGWEVRNLGVSAWGPSNALGYLETEGSAIGGSCLVYGIFEGNDVMDNVVYHLYAMKDGALAQVPVTAPVPTRLSRVRDLLRDLPLYDALLEHSQLFNVIRTAGLNTLVRHDPSIPKEDPYTHATKETFATALDLNDRVLDRLSALARSRFGAFALVLIPMRAQLDPKAPAPFPAWMGDETHARVLAWAQKNAVPVLDAREGLPKDPEGLAKSYFARDFHLDVEGNRALGRMLGERLPSMCAKQP
jgi:hypothetical protein